MPDPTGPAPSLTPPPRNAPELDRPQAPEQRSRAMDVLRGVAVLGILPVNIPTFALPMIAFYRPPTWGGFTGADFLVWLTTHLFFEFKFITIFSMLFGAGLVLIASRAEQTGRSPLAAYYTRLAWLALFGLLHMALLWYGDILFAYALWGMLLYPLRRLAPPLLIALGLTLALLWIPLMTGLGLLTQFAAASDPSAVDSLMPTMDDARAEVTAMNGSFLDALRVRAEHVLFVQLGGQFFFYPWRVFGVMLVGMGLMKLGVFSGARSSRFYALCAALGYGSGLPLIAVGVTRLLRHDFDPIELYKLDWHFNYVGSLCVAMGHVGAVMLLVRAGWARRLLDRLQAVGRMALTNYLAQSLICATIFTGWGLGQFGQLERTWLALIVLGIWAVQLLWSPLWLARFGFGPMEWLWRTLAYRRAQPMRRPAGAAAQAPAMLDRDA